MISSESEPLYAGCTSLAVSEDGKAIVGGSDGVVGVYSVAEKSVVSSFKAGAAVTDAIWRKDEAIVSTSSGAVLVSGDEATTYNSHAGAANALALHPCGDILASVGVDKSFVFYDLVGKKAVTQVYTNSGTHGNYPAQFFY